MSKIVKVQSDVWHGEPAKIKGIIKEIQEISSFNSSMQKYLTDIIEATDSSKKDKTFAWALQFIVDSVAETRIKVLNISNRLEAIETEITGRPPLKE